ncbi:UNVERIFIED_CONTAM: hypothetical protein Sindi_2014600 [Sesamum indicum]
MRGSLLNQKDGNLAKDKSSFRAPPFLGFSSSTLEWRTRDGCFSLKTSIWQNSSTLRTELWTLAAETEKSSDSGDILGGSGGKHGCTGAPSSDLALVTGKQAEGTNPIAAVIGLGVPPETQISPENEQFTAMNRRTPTYADVEPANDDVENAE